MAGSLNESETEWWLWGVAKAGCLAEEGVRVGEAVGGGDITGTVRSNNLNRGLG